MCKVHAVLAVAVLHVSRFTPVGVHRPYDALFLHTVLLERTIPSGQLSDIPLRELG